MSQTLQIINIIVLAFTIWFVMKRPSEKEQKKRQKLIANDEEIKKHKLAVLKTSYDQEYDPHQWYFKMPDPALKNLEACFEGDERKVYLLKRAIELSIEHFAQEMEDDAACARIIEERVFNNPKPTTPFDIEEYKRYRDERIEHEGVFESLQEWKTRTSQENKPSEDGSQTNSNSTI